jgi:ABC-2 type transport system permease protein
MKRLRFLKVTRRVFLDLRNDKRSLAMISIAPIFAMFVFGLAFSGQVKNVGFVVVNQDAGTQVIPGGPTVKLSDKVVANLDKKTLDVREGSSASAAEAQIKDGKAYASVIFPPDFTARVLAENQGASNGTVELQVMMDQSNINVANAITRAINDVLLKTMDQAGKKLPVTVSVDAVYGKNAKFMDFFVPGIMAFVVYLITTLLTLITFVGERTSGTLDRMLSTPLSETDIVTSPCIQRNWHGTGAPAASDRHPGVPYLSGRQRSTGFHRDRPAGCGLPGYGHPSLEHRQERGAGYSGASLRNTAGIFWPVEAIPSWLRPFSYIVPPTYAVDASRSVMLKGWGLSKIWIDIVALLALAVFFLTMATLSLRRRKD